MSEEISWLGERDSEEAVEVPDPRCIKPNHLRSGTHAQNIRDSRRNGSS